MTKITTYLGKDLEEMTKDPDKNKRYRLLFRQTLTKKKIREAKDAIRTEELKLLEAINKRLEATNKRLEDPRPFTEEEKRKLGTFKGTSKMAKEKGEEMIEDLKKKVSELQKEVDKIESELKELDTKIKSKKS